MGQLNQYVFGYFIGNIGKNALLFHPNGASVKFEAFLQRVGFAQGDIQLVQMPQEQTGAVLDPTHNEHVTFFRLIC